MLRLPRTLPSQKTAEQYGIDGHVGVTATPESVIIELIDEDNSGAWVEGAGDSLCAIAGVRSELAGDLVQARMAPRLLTLPGESQSLAVTAARGGARERSTLPAARTRRPPWAALSLLGPAFVVSVAYVDPGNFATNFAGGAGHGYALAWVVVMASLMAVLVQYLAAKVGLSTGRSLPELCRDRFGRRANVMLWVQAEVVAMATDLAEFVGAAVGLNLVFGLPLLAAGLITAVVAFVILALEQRRRRRFELAIIALLMLVGAGFAYLLIAAGDGPYGQLAAGLVPRLSGAGTLSLTVAIIGATVMPHVVYLHSALHKDRIRATGGEERRRLLTANKWDCVVGLGAAGLVNLAMLCVAAALFHKPGLTGIGNLAAVHSHLGSLAGGGAALAFAIALMASGLSSSSVGTFAGQVIMAGFMNWRAPVTARRGVTMLPSLIILALAVNPSQALVYSQIVLSFGIPFALVPLLLISRDRSVMTDMANRRLTSGLMLLTTIIITALNLCLLYGTVTGLPA